MDMLRSHRGYHRWCLFGSFVLDIIYVIFIRLVSPLIAELVGRLLGAVPLLWWLLVILRIVLWSLVVRAVFAEGGVVVRQAGRRRMCCCILNYVSSFDSLELSLAFWSSWLEIVLILRIAMLPMHDLVTIARKWAPVELGIAWLMQMSIVRIHIAIAHELLVVHRGRRLAHPHPLLVLRELQTR